MHDGRTFLHASMRALSQHGAEEGQIWVLEHSCDPEAIELSVMLPVMAQKISSYWSQRKPSEGSQESKNVYIHSYRRTSQRLQQ